MFTAASPLSIKAAFESMLTWTSSKTNRPAPENKTWPRKRDIFSIIVTPDRIPKFCIPSLEVDYLPSENETVGAQHEKSSRSRPPGKTTQRHRPMRSKSELCIRKEETLSHASWGRRETLCLTSDNISLEHLERAGDHSDPVTRAALSLPHLSKITTPYGFLTLGESPNIRRKESLFFGYGSAELRILISQKKEAACRGEHSVNPLAMHSQPRCWEKSSSKNHWFVSQGKHSNKQTSSVHYALASERGASKSEKKRFQLLMKRHLHTIKRLSSHRASVEKITNQTEKSLSNSVC